MHIIGNDACELIHFGMELINAGRTIFDVLGSVFTAVTFHVTLASTPRNGRATPPQPARRCMPSTRPWRGALSQPLTLASPIPN